MIVDVEKQITINGSPSAKEAERRAIAEKVRAFEASGKRIRQIPRGVGVGTPGLATKAGRRATFERTAGARAK